MTRRIMNVSWENPFLFVKIVNFLNNFIKIHFSQRFGGVAFGRKIGIAVGQHVQKKMGNKPDNKGDKRLIDVTTN